MNMRLAIVAALAAIAIPLTSAGTQAADPPKAGVPESLKFVPSDAAAFVHIDIAALTDGPLAALFKTNPLTGGSDLGIGAKLGDLQSMTVAYSVSERSSSNLTVYTFREKYDRSKVVAAVKKSYQGGSVQVTEKDNQLSTSVEKGKEREVFWFQPTVIDLSDPKRIVSVTGMPESSLKPGELPALFADAVKANTEAVLLVGLNPGKLPAEAKKADNLPPPLKAIVPLLEAESVFLVGSVGKESITLTATAKGKDKDAAAVLEKAFGAGLLLLADGVESTGKWIQEESDHSKEIAKLTDAVAKAFKQGKSSSAGNVTQATVSIPTESATAATPALVGALKQAAERTQVSNNWKQIGLAFHNHEAAFGKLPTSAISDKKGKKLLSWRVAVLPYIEEDTLYKKFKLDEPWDSEHNLKVLKENPMPRAYTVPGTKSAEEKKTHFQVFVGNGAIFAPDKALTIVSISDGTSNTLFGALAKTPVEWTKPDDIEFDPNADMRKLLLPIRGKIAAVFGDGSVRNISDEADEKTLKAAITANGGEVYDPSELEKK